MCCHLVSTPLKLLARRGGGFRPGIRTGNRFASFAPGGGTNEGKWLQIHIRTYDRYAGWPTHTPTGNKAANEPAKSNWQHQPYRVTGHQRIGISAPRKRERPIPGYPIPARIPRHLHAKVTGDYSRGWLRWHEEFWKENTIRYVWKGTPSKIWYKKSKFLSKS